MCTAKRHPAWLLVVPAVVMGCADQPPLDPALVQQREIESLAASSLEAVTPAASREALTLSPELRTAMRSTLEAALAEYGIQPHAARGALHQFFREMDGRQGPGFAGMGPKP